MDCLTSALGICPVCTGTHTGSKAEPVKPNTITSIAEVNGKVLVVFDDGTYKEASMGVVDENLNTNINAQMEMDTLKAKVKELEETFTRLGLALEPVTGLDGNTSFKAFNVNFTI